MEQILTLVDENTPAAAIAELAAVTVGRRRCQLWNHPNCPQDVLDAALADPELHDTVLLHGPVRADLVAATIRDRRAGCMFAKQVALSPTLLAVPEIGAALLERLTSVVAGNILDTLACVERIAANTSHVAASTAMYVLERRAAESMCSAEIIAAHRRLMLRLPAPAAHTLLPLSVDTIDRLCLTIAACSDGTDPGVLPRFPVHRTILQILTHLLDQCEADRPERRRSALAVVVANTDDDPGDYIASWTRKLVTATAKAGDWDDNLFAAFPLMEEGGIAATIHARFDALPELGDPLWWAEFVDTVGDEVATAALLGLFHSPFLSDPALTDLVWATLKDLGALGGVRPRRCAGGRREELVSGELRATIGNDPHRLVVVERMVLQPRAVSLNAIRTELEAA